MVIIRPILQSDYEQWLPLWQGYLAFYKSTVTDEVTTTTFQRFLDEAEDVWAIVAVEGDRLVGCSHFLAHRSTWSVEKVLYLNDLFVDPTFRSHGTGRQLIEYVKQFARSKHYAKLYWLTQETNYRARILYDTLADRSGLIQYVDKF